MTINPALYVLALSTILYGASALSEAKAPAWNLEPTSYSLFLGGGEADMSSGQYFSDNHVTILRYGAGIDFEQFSVESAYRGYHDSSNFKVKGLDVIARYPFAHWKDLSFDVGAGAYLYQSKLNSDLFDNTRKKRAASPLASFGVNYHLTSRVDFKFQYDHILGFKYPSPSSNNIDKKGLNQFIASLVLNFPIEPIRIIEYPDPEPVYIPYEGVFQSDLFEYDSAQIKPDMQYMFNHVIETIEQLEHSQITIIGSADSKDAYLNYNQRLASQRAQAVEDLLVERGIEQEQITKDVEIYHLSDLAEFPAARYVRIIVRELDN
ncbi:OmpA family protein [Vibrio sp. FNV 38]|nr:OmpA family protein [Vibrio sp. FNV 38]